MLPLPVIPYECLTQVSTSLRPKACSQGSIEVGHDMLPEHGWGPLTIPEVEVTS